MPPPAFDDAQIVYLDEHYSGQSSANVHWMIFRRRRRTNPVVDGQLVPKKRAPRKRRREEEEADAPTCAICLDPTTVTLICGHAMCEECMGRLAVFQGQTVTRSRRRVVIQCPLRCLAPTERVLA
jgi:hypothetical protein